MIMILKLRVLLILWISSLTDTVMCETSTTRMSCTYEITSSLLSQCSAERDKSQFGMIADSIRQFIPHLQSQQCRKQILIFSNSLTNSSLWAVQMLDASAKNIKPGGYHLGHFDECIDIDLKRDIDNIRGKYCLADVSEYGDFERSRMGICVPNECGHQDTQIMLERYLTEMKKHSVTVTVPEKSCFTKERIREKISYILLTYGVLGLVFWNVCVTMIDLISVHRKGSNELWLKVTEIFSCYRSIRKLTCINAENGLSGIHFMRVATIFVLIMHQRHQLMIQSPVRNLSYLQKLSLSPWPIFDTLIFLTGFLTVHGLQNESLTNTKWKCFLLCMAKWLRIIPLYVAMIVFYAVAFEDVGDGPLWVERIGQESRRCGDFWWANLSLVNNYISATGQCIAQSWYLAVTSHGFVVTLIFMHLKTGKAFIGLGSLTVTLTMTLVLFLWNDNTLRGQDGLSAFDDLYIKTQYRLPAFILGAVSAHLYQNTRQCGSNTTWVHFLTPFVLTMSGLVSILCHRLDNEFKIILALVSSITWSVFIGLIIIIFPLYNIKASNSLLLKNIFIPLSRLSYPALFSHTVIQLYMVASVRTSEYVTFPRLVWMGAADILASYVFALLLYLIIDGPVVSAMRIILWRKEKKTDEIAEYGKGKK